VITISEVNKAFSATRASACWNVERSPTSGKELLRNGVARDRPEPVPPAMITGAMRESIQLQRTTAWYLLR
jgi:hypothetical protein